MFRFRKKSRYSLMRRISAQANNRQFAVLLSINKTRFAVRPADGAYAILEHGLFCKVHALFAAERGCSIMQKHKMKTRFLVQASLIAAIYTALCLVLHPISFGFGGIELRVSEALTLLPVLMPAAVPGLFAGCLLSNLMGGATALDIVFGSLTTLAAALLTRRLRNRPVLAALPPVLLNAAVIGTLLRYAYGVAMPLWLCMLSIGLGQAAVCYAIGLPLLRMMRRIPERYFRP